MKINVPDSWDSVTVNQYQALTQINREDYKSDLDYSASVIQILCELENISNLPLSAIVELAPYISFLSEEVSKEKYQTILIDGVKYSWIDSFEAITVGEAVSVELPIDLEELSFTMAYDVVLAVMLREEGKPFDAKEFNNNRVRFGELPITQVIGMLLFFLSGGKTSTAHLKTYSIVPKRTTISHPKRLRRWKRILKSLKLISG